MDDNCNSEVWSVKYRPTTLDEFIGNVSEVRTFLKNKKVPSTLLISGPSGTGKSTLGRIIARELNGGKLTNDVQEINVSDKRGVDDIRGLASLAKLKPTIKGGKRVFILDECQTLLAQSQSILLKILEEPPSTTVFILCTDQPEKLSSQIKYRCRQISVGLKEPTELVPLLYSIYKKEGLNFTKDKEKLKKILIRISEDSGGQPRAALQAFKSFSDRLKSDPDANLDESLEKSILVNIDLVATKILLGIYTNNPKIVLSALNDTEEYVPLLQRLLDQSLYVMQHTLKVSNVVTNYSCNKLQQILDKDKISILDKRAIQVHLSITELASKLSNFLVKEKHLYSSFLANLALNLP